MTWMLLGPIDRLETRRDGGFDLVLGGHILDLLGEQLAQVAHGAQLRQTQGFSYCCHHRTQHASRPSEMIEAILQLFFSPSHTTPRATRLPPGKHTSKHLALSCSSKGTYESDQHAESIVQTGHFVYTRRWDCAAGRGLD